MELSKKTTILLSPELHRRLTQLAEQKGVSLGELVRQACEKHYGIVSREDRIAAAKGLADLRLPVSDVQSMVKESSADPEDLLP